jgi:hypothetical protein
VLLAKNINEGHQVPTCNFPWSFFH